MLHDRPPPPPRNFMHGGATASLIDLVSSAVFATMGHNIGVSLEINVSYLDAVFGGVSTATLLLLICLRLWVFCPTTVFELDSLNKIPSFWFGGRGLAIFPVMP